MPIVNSVITKSSGGSSLPPQSGHAGEFLTTDGTNASWASVSGGGQIIQYNEIPEPSDEFENSIIQYIGETNMPYINGYFYKCVEEEDEESTFYIWKQINVQPQLEQPHYKRGYGELVAWTIDNDGEPITIYTQNAQPNEGDEVFTEHGYTIPGIILKQGNLRIPYVGLLRVQSYLPAWSSYPERLTLTMDGGFSTLQVPDDNVSVLALKVS